MNIYIPVSWEKKPSDLTMMMTNQRRNFRSNKDDDEPTKKLQI
ncbi:hypothetical protein Patl1_35957 [Pistacia atlantica]|nr:hypothetical protein Patl1_35957 [Pistacia atlantica]